MPPPLVTLTTDFGMRDPYVSAMKGVILSLCRDVDLVDLTHDISPGSALSVRVEFTEAGWFSNIELNSNLVSIDRV